MTTDPNLPVDWSHFISTRGRAWLPSPIRGLFPLERTPGKKVPNPIPQARTNQLTNTLNGKGMISFLAGKPK